MIKKIIFVCLVAAISYYAGSKDLTTKDIFNFFKKNHLGEELLNKVDKTFELANEKNLNKKVKEVVETLKN